MEGKRSVLTGLHNNNIKCLDVLGVPIATINLDQAVERIVSWISEEARRYVTVTGVHGVMESQDDPEILRFHQQADMCVPDGMPLVWLGRWAGFSNMGRVYGPDLMLAILKQCEKMGYSSFFYGGKLGIPERLRDCLLKRFPALRVVGTHSPPFRPMTEQEEQDFEERIRILSPDIIWVGLSTPKQERWMASHVNRLDARVLIGVGAAFDFHAGLVRQAPPMMQKCGLEWFYRLCTEPRRLWRRYIYNNPRFVWNILRQKHIL